MVNQVTNNFNPFKQSYATWLVELIINFEHLPCFEELFDGMAETIAYFEYEATEKLENLAEDKWVLQLFFNEKPNLDQLELLANDLAVSLNIAPPLLILSNIDDKDWVEEVQKNFPPLKIGRYFIHGSHYQEKLPASSIPILIDAGRAFGTGEHATTEGCLMAMSELAKHYNFNNILDMGCGTGILAIAAAKTWKSKVIAVDIDAQAVKITGNNAKINQLAKFITTAVSDGYNSNLVRNNGQYDLIIANILAKPLIKFAPYLKNNLAKGGVAILSGLLYSQQKMVLSAHITQGLYVKKIITNNFWSTIILSNE